MRYGMTVTLLLLTAGLTVLPTGRLVADEAAKPRCSDRLIGIEQRLEGAGLAAHRQAQIRQIIDGAPARSTDWAMPGAASTSPTSSIAS
jgi:hypothetical protein